MAATNQQGRPGERPSGATEINGTPAPVAGFWRDRHGHTVFRCDEEVLPACPQFPYGITRWRLVGQAACGHDQAA